MQERKMEKVKIQTTQACLMDIAIKNHKYKVIKNESNKKLSENSQNIKRWDNLFKLELTHYYLYLTPDSSMCSQWKQLTMI